MSTVYKLGGYTMEERDEVAIKLNLRQVYFDGCIKRENGCLEWCGTVNPNNYPQARFRGLTFVIHRFIAFGSFTAFAQSRLVVLHTCDNTICIAPEHLQIGTYKENSQDSIRKGRNSPPPIHLGENNNGAKLRQVDVDEIRAKWEKERFSITAVAKRYGVSTKAIQRIIKNRSWVSK